MALAKWVLGAVAVGFSAFLVTQMVGNMRSSKPAAAQAGGQAPSARLVGHWTSAAGDQLFFGPADASGVGSYTLVQAPAARVFNHRYKVEADHPMDGGVDTTVLFANGDSRAQTFRIADDGKTMESLFVLSGDYIRSQHTRVDDSTAP